MIDKFLSSYNGYTYNNYKSALTKLQAWASDKNLLELSKHDLEEFFKSQSPKLLSSSLSSLFIAIKSFYNYALHEGHITYNPMATIRKKQFTITEPRKIRRLTKLQLDLVLSISKKVSKKCPKKYEKSRFIIYTLYLMFLRISELSYSTRWIPRMNHFFQDESGLWWFVTVGKGNKKREVAVSNEMLENLKQWRTYLGLTPLPSPDDNSYLLPATHGGALGTRQIRNIVKEIFDLAAQNLHENGYELEAKNLSSATVHWLRHTGISDAVKYRPREHVRDDAGHSSSAITDLYIDIERSERHASAQRG